MGDTTRTTTSRRTTARRTDTTDRRPADDHLDETETDTVSADEAQEAEATGRHVTATLCGEDVRVIPPAAWRQSWQRLLNQGQIDAFAAIVLHEDDYELYLELDPTNEEFGDMIGEAAERAGESLGKSRGPATSSRRTRRR
ncbi:MULTISPECIES: hypothetical protein [unclassified Streptomyces]|uniref:hypothetical protein n=1 Tax=unclassified Streptomyces TaxID=2593676 RepID=UPI0019CF5BF3|nr:MULTISPECIES: hypothetical protein [unclassified Streptomyces]